MQTVKHLNQGTNLTLESCPQPVQVMPPESSHRSFPLAVTVFIDTILVTLLLGGVMLMPAWILSILS